MTDEYTPTVEEVRRQWNNAVRSDLVPARSAEFDRMIAEVERAAAVKALRAAADQLPYMDNSEVVSVRRLRIRADRIEKGESA